MKFAILEFWSTENQFLIVMSLNALLLNYHCAFSREEVSMLLNCHKNSNESKKYLHLKILGKISGIPWIVTLLIFWMYISFACRHMIDLSSIMCAMCSSWSTTEYLINIFKMNTNLFVHFLNKLSQKKLIWIKCDLRKTDQLSFKKRI